MSSPAAPSKSRGILGGRERKMTLLNKSGDFGSRGRDVDCCISGIPLPFAGVEERAEANSDV